MNRDFITMQYSLSPGKAIMSSSGDFALMWGKGFEIREQFSFANSIMKFQVLSSYWGWSLHLEICQGNISREHKREDTIRALAPNSAALGGRIKLQNFDKNEKRKENDTRTWHSNVERLRIQQSPSHKTPLTGQCGIELRGCDNNLMHF